MNTFDGYNALDKKEVDMYEKVFTHIFKNDIGLECNAIPIDIDGENEIPKEAVNVMKIMSPEERIKIASKLLQEKIAEVTRGLSYPKKYLVQSEGAVGVISVLTNAMKIQDAESFITAYEDTGVTPYANYLKSVSMQESDVKDAYVRLKEPHFKNLIDKQIANITKIKEIDNAHTFKRNDNKVIAELVYDMISGIRLSTEILKMMADKVIVHDSIKTQYVIYGEVQLAMFGSSNAFYPRIDLFIHSIDGVNYLSGININEVFSSKGYAEVKPFVEAVEEFKSATDNGLDEPFTNIKGGLLEPMYTYNKIIESIDTNGITDTVNTISTANNISEIDGYKILMALIEIAQLYSSARYEESLHMKELEDILDKVNNIITVLNIHKLITE